MHNKINNIIKTNQILKATRIKTYLIIKDFRLKTNKMLKVSKINNLVLDNLFLIKFQVLRGRFNNNSIIWSITHFKRILTIIRINNKMLI